MSGRITRDTIPAKDKPCNSTSARQSMEVETIGIACAVIGRWKTAIIRRNSAKRSGAGVVTRRDECVRRSKCCEPREGLTNWGYVNGSKEVSEEVGAAVDISLTRDLRIWVGTETSSSIPSTDGGMSQTCYDRLWGNLRCRMYVARVSRNGIHPHPYVSHGVPLRDCRRLLLRADALARKAGG